MIAPALDWALAWWRAPQDAARRRRGGGCVGARAGRRRAAFAIAYAPQLLAYIALNGYPRPSPLVARKMNWLSPHALDVLASPEHGLLFWTPLALLAIVGLAAGVAGRFGWAARPTLAPPPRQRLDGVDRAVPAARRRRRRSTSPAASNRGRWPARSASAASSACRAVFLVGLAALWPIARSARRGRRGARARRPVDRAARRSACGGTSA